ncbi:hypothetical protein LTR48_009037, partial [Friedmanniomyces endolithicus]
MQETLDDEGWGVGLSEFQKLRRINGFTRRVNDGAHVGAPARKRKRGEAEVMEEPGDQAWTVAGSSAGATVSAYQKPSMSQGEDTRRANRLAQIQFDSDNALLTRRRRRRIRNYGHLPPDAPNMAPRYNTETTLDECKAFLHLNNDMYTAIRQDYEVICRDMGIERKKTFLSNG